MKNKLIVFFFIVFLGELVGISLNQHWLEWICKPLIMVTLGVYYITSSNREESSISKPVLGAIIFSLAGDVALMFQTQDEIYFMLGLASFLIAHICYVLAYNQHKGEKVGVGLFGIQKFRFALPIVLAGTGLITILYNHLGSMKIPVIVYSLVIIIMVLQSIFRFGHTNAKSFWFVFVGALLFMFSDSMIAVNKFLSSFESSSQLIMISYMLAQFLIIEGLLSHFETK